MTGPTNLRAAMIARAGDLAHYMLRRGMQVEVATGKTPNGHPCVVIMAIGEAADVAEQVGLTLLEQVERERIENRGRASRG